MSASSYKALQQRRREDQKDEYDMPARPRRMISIQSLALIAGILLLGSYAILRVAEDALARQDRICQEGCY